MSPLIALPNNQSFVGGWMIVVKVVVDSLPFP